MNSYRNIAIIPARGGSKRIPKKNIKDFLGKPIIAYSIEAALNSNLFDEIMVSTDDVEIASIAKRYGGNIPFMRSKKNADDFATITDVLIEVLEEYKKHDYEFDYVCCIYPTAPFVTPKKLLETFNLLIESNADSVIPVVKFSYPIQRALRITRDNRLEYVWPENYNKRSQDLESTYHDAGQFFWIKTKSLYLYKRLINGLSIPFIIDEISAQDIDSEEDFILAKIKYKFINGIYDNEL